MCILLIFAVILLAGGASAGSDCPSASSLYPCTCSEGSTGAQITCDVSLLPGDGSQVFDIIARIPRPTTIYDFTIKNFGFEKIPGRAFAGLTIDSVYLMYGEKLTTIHADAFAGIGGLRSLYVEETALSAIPCQIFPTMPDLELLFIRYSSLEKLDDGCLIDASNLSQLVLDNNVIFYISPQALRGLKKLKLTDDELALLFREALLVTLSLDPGVTVLDLAMKARCFSRKRLDMSNNAIEYIAPGTFKDIDEIAAISLQSNHLYTVSAGTYAGLKEIGIIDLEYNRISSIAAGAFEGATAAFIINISNNNLVTIAADTFRGLSSVTEVWIDNNSLSFIEPGSFHGMPKIFNIDFRNNERLTSIDKDVFNLTELTSQFVMFNLEGKLQIGLSM
ncbi:PREDICTED: insulin-like growth factor-binding protein complex acid labile subunit [Priapulus caudatus]|uniref:Insulin-like growth factor-binding protein complex acid labile subunit n=1 Tax=Priapulus caudatus TaxID=37621 RepID=A0ABM1DU29_PRICU|nr:PREDICTED: insulin-like growth factor-binding protein complex acid labile subunit [Priapulus caudatus]